jgi:hypothetical protein
MVNIENVAYTTLALIFTVNTRGHKCVYLYLQAVCSYNKCLNFTCISAGHPAYNESISSDVTKPIFMKFGSW